MILSAIAVLLLCAAAYREYHIRRNLYGRMPGTGLHRPHDLERWEAIRSRRGPSKWELEQQEQKRLLATQEHRRQIFERRARRLAPRNLKRKSPQQIAHLVWRRAKQYAGGHMIGGRAKEIAGAASLLLVADAILTTRHAHRVLMVRAPFFEELVARSDHETVNAAVKIALERFGRRLILEPSRGLEQTIAVMIATAAFHSAEDRSIKPSQDAQGSARKAPAEWKFGLNGNLFLALAEEGWHQNRGYRAIFRRLAKLVTFRGQAKEWTALIDAVQLYGSPLPVQGTR